MSVARLRTHLPSKQWGSSHCIAHALDVHSPLMHHTAKGQAKTEAPATHHSNVLGSYTVQLEVPTRGEPHYSHRTGLSLGSCTNTVFTNTVHEAHAVHTNTKDRACDMRCAQQQGALLLPCLSLLGMPLEVPHMARLPINEPVSASQRAVTGVPDVMLPAHDTEHCHSTCTWQDRCV